jgi:hypothetical protein
LTVKTSLGPGRDNADALEKKSVFLLRFDKAMTHLDGFQFSATHAAIPQFLRAGRNIRISQRGQTAG